jgi:putative holliday junction resolvase
VPTGRVLGIDFGERRIGLALSDPTATLATPLDTLVRRPGKRVPLKALEELARHHGVEHLVVGLPLDLRGEESEWCRAVRRSGDELARRLGVPVDFVDERFTSVSAARTVRESGLNRTERGRKERVDQAAAALILQRWLDARKRAAAPEPHSRLP